MEISAIKKHHKDHNTSLTDIIGKIAKIIKIDFVRPSMKNGSFVIEDSKIIEFEKGDILGDPPYIKTFKVKIKCNIEFEIEELPKQKYLT